MKQKPTNQVHLHGFVNDVRINASEDGTKHFINVNLATYEQYKGNDGEKTRKNTYHTVNFATSDKAVVEKFEKVAEALSDNLANREVEGFEPQVFKASVDGVLITRESEKDGVKYYNQIVATNSDDFKLGAKRQEGESMNTASFKGNIANVEIHDDFAIVSIATHYYAPGESQIHTGETKPYTEKTSFVRTRVYQNFKSKAFEALKSGELAKGDLIEVRGQMHNNKFTDGNGITRYGIIVDLNKVDLVAKKKVEQAVEEKPAEKAKAEKKETKKTNKKATPKPKRTI